MFQKYLSRVDSSSLFRSSRNRLLVRCLTTASRPKTAKGNDFNLLIIGGGPAGYAGAIRGWDYGQSVCLVDAPRVEGRVPGLGGVGIHYGALSSKTMWQLSRRNRMIRSAFTEAGLVYDEQWRDIVKLTLDAEAAKERQMRTQLTALTHANPFGVGGHIELVEARAKFINPHTVTLSKEGEGEGEEEKVVTADHFLIATGSSPRDLAQYPADGVHILNSDHIASMTDFPESMAIIGAGVIGCEYATIFSSFGRTKVHLVNQRRERLLPQEDEDMSLFLSRNFERAGVSIHNQCQLMSLDKVDKGVRVTLAYQQAGSKDYIPAEPFVVEKVLMSVGRVPNTKGVGLEQAGVAMDASGGISVDDHGRSTTQPHVFAAGDVTADIGLVNVAEMEGRHAVETMFCSEECPTPLSHDNVSTIMFLRPEVSCVGMNEQEARHKAIPHRVAVVGMDTVNRAIINRPQYVHDPSALLEGTGYVKMIVTDDEQARLLGMRAVGEDASALIQSAALLIGHKLSIRQLERTIQPHPATAEAVQECVRMLLGRSMTKPHIFPSCWLRRYDPKNPEDTQWVMAHAKHPQHKQGSQASVPTYMDDSG